MQIETKISSLISKSFTTQIFTNITGIARTSLALSLLLTLLFNTTDNLWPSINGHPANYSLIHYSGYNFFLLLGFSNIYILKFIACLLLTLIALGISPRYTCVFHWWVQYSFIQSSSAVDGGDQIVSNLALLLIPICLLDSRKTHWQNKKETNSYILIFTNFVHKLIRLQVAVIYLHAAVGKFVVTEWIDGTALYYWLNSSFFKMPDWMEAFMNPILSNHILGAVLTWSSFLLELLLFLGIVMQKKYRILLMYAGILFHFAILVSFGLISFFFSISAALILYLQPLDKPFVYRSYKLSKAFSREVRLFKSFSRRLSSLQHFRRSKTV